MLESDLNRFGQGLRRILKKEAIETSNRACSLTAIASAKTLAQKAEAFML